jgi:glutamyl-tRNA synthetase
LIERFSLERVGKNPATFDTDKLEWLNGHYIRSSSPQRLADELVPFCVRAGLPADTPEGRARLQAAAPLLVERLKTLDEAPPMVRFLFEDVTPDDVAATAVAGEGDYLAEVHATLEAVGEWNAETLEAALRDLAEKRELKPRKAFQPIRAAVTGTLVSPPLFESLEILGREVTLERLRRIAAA